MSKMAVHFSSATDLWSTPQDFYEELNREFGFELDVCASVDNAKCEKFFTKEDDGLKQPWEGVCWMNPPYGRERSADGCTKRGFQVDSEQLLFALFPRGQTPPGGMNTRQKGRFVLSEVD